MFFYIYVGLFLLNLSSVVNAIQEGKDRNSLVLSILFTVFMAYCAWDERRAILRKKEDEKFMKDREEFFKNKGMHND